MKKIKVFVFVAALAAAGMSGWAQDYVYADKATSADERVVFDYLSSYSSENGVLTMGVIVPDILVEDGTTLVLYSKGGGITVQNKKFKTNNGETVFVASVVANRYGTVEINLIHIKTGINYENEFYLSSLVNNDWGDVTEECILLRKTR